MASGTVSAGTSIYQWDGVVYTIADTVEHMLCCLSFGQLFAAIDALDSQDLEPTPTDGDSGSPAGTDLHPGRYRQDEPAGLFERVR